MAYKWRILRSAVEQEILFPSEACYKAYLDTLNKKGEPYSIVSEKASDNGEYIVIMRKRYNYTTFLKA